jgi:hypothetical protein
LQQPPAAVVAKNNVNLNGNLTVNNTATGISIWSGGGVTLTGSATTQGTNGAGSNKNGIGTDVVQNDSGLAALTGAQLFQSFFGMTETQAQQRADIAYTNSGTTDYSSALGGVTGQTIWINQNGGNATFNSNTTIGSPSNPVVLIINGNINANGNCTIYGMVYVLGDWINGGGGTLTINGAVVVQGNLQSTGTPNVNYVTPILSNSTKLGNFAKLPGSWHDF